MRLSRADSFFTSSTDAPPHIEPESEERLAAKKADSLPTGTDKEGSSSSHRRSQLSAMDSLYPIMRCSELPSFGIRVSVRSWVQTIVERCKKAGHYGEEVRARVRNMRVVSFTHYKERGGSGHEYAVARLRWVEGHESQEAREKVKIHKGDKRCNRGEDGGAEGNEGTRGGRPDGQVGKVTQEKPDTFLRFERGGPRTVPTSCEPLQDSMTIASVSRREPDDFVTRIDQSPSTESASVIADATWQDRADADRPTLLSLAIACFTVHKHDTGCYFKKSQCYAFANTLVALLSNKFGHGNLVISPEGGKWWYLPIYTPKADVGQSLLATYKENSIMIQEMIKEGIAIADHLQRSIGQGRKEFRGQTQQFNQAQLKEIREQIKRMEQQLDKLEGRVKKCEEQSFKS